MAVVGRGIAGLSLARELLFQTKKSIVLIGPEKALPGSATIVAQGVSAVKGLVLGKEPLFVAKLAGHRFLKKWLAEVSRESGLGVSFDGAGVGEISTTMEDLQWNMTRAYHRRFQGIFGAVSGTFSGSESWPGSASSKRPFGADPYRGHHQGVLHPEDFWFDPEEALCALENLLSKAPHQVTSVFRTAAALSLEDSGLVQIRFDGEEVVNARHVVLAAGHQTPNLLAGILGSSQGSDFGPLKTAGWSEVGGETLTFPALKSGPLAFSAASFRGTSLGVSSFVRRTHSLTRKKNGCLIAGSTAQKTLEKPFAKKPVSPVESMAYEIEMMAGHQATDPAAWQSRFGLRLRTKDRAPVCGRLSGFADRIWVFSGFYKNGLQLAPLMAADLAQAIASNDETVISKQCIASRFGV